MGEGFSTLLPFLLRQKIHHTVQVSKGLNAKHSLPNPISYKKKRIVLSFKTCSGQTAVVATVVAVLLFTVFLIILFCILKKSKTKKRKQNTTHTDVNPVYGDYYYPEPKAEAVDTNDYYSSDYEEGTGTSRTTDNNEYYE